MLQLRLMNSFKHDLKICHKRHYDISLLETVVDILRIPDKLPDKYRDHQLTGKQGIYRDCHILPDWILLYRYDGDFLELYRTGTHADLFR